MSRIPTEVERSTHARLAAVRPALLALALGLACAACSEGPGSTDLADELAPHEEAIGRFAQWAERTARSARPGERERARLDETLFAPVRGEPRFRVVAIEREGRSPLHAVHPRDAVIPTLAWRSVRTRSLGTVEVARDPHDATVLWARVPAESLTLTLALAPVGEPPPS